MKAGERKENMGAWLRRLGRAMKDDRGGYAMITVLVICGMVVGMFIWATLTIVEQSYTAQERQFARQTELLKAQGNLEATRANLEAWASEEEPIDWDTFTGTIGEKLIGHPEMVETFDIDGLTDEEKNDQKAEREIEVEADTDSVKKATDSSTKATTIKLEITLNNSQQITEIKTSYVSYEEVRG